MSVSLIQVQDLQVHLLGMLKRMSPGPGEVSEALLSLMGAILWRKNPQHPIKVNTKDGLGGNVVWFRVDDTRYALLYSQEERVIQLLEGGRKGTVVQTFTHATSGAEVARVFAALGRPEPGANQAGKPRREGREPKEPKDPQRKAARQLARAAKTPKDPQAKAAKVAAKDAKVKAQREQRRATRADAQATAPGAGADTPDDPTPVA